MLLPTRPNPIGIDLGASALKACQHDAHGRPVASLVLPRRAFGAEHDAAELARLAQMLDRQGFVGRRVVAACPWNSIISESLRLPPAESGAPRAALAAAEMARLRQLTPGTFEIGFWPIPAPARGGEGSFVMASVATHQQTNAYLDHFDAAGLDLVALDTPAGALCRGVLADLAGRRGMTLIIDLGHRQARSVVMAEGVVVFERGNDEAGLIHVLDQIKEALQVDDEAAGLLLRKAGLSSTTKKEGDLAQDPAWREALAEVRSLVIAHFDAVARELAMALNYVGHRYPDLAIETGLMTGGGALLPGVQAYLSSALGLPIQTPGGDPQATLCVTAGGLAAHAQSLRRAAA